MWKKLILSGALPLCGEFREYQLRTHLRNSGARSKSFPEPIISLRPFFCLKFLACRFTSSSVAARQLFEQQLFQFAEALFERLQFGVFGAEFFGLSVHFLV